MLLEPIINERSFVIIDSQKTDIRIGMIVHNTDFNIETFNIK